jgi:uncharacterized protein YbcI
VDSKEDAFFLKRDEEEFINLKKTKDELSSIKKKVNNVFIKNIIGRKIVKLTKAKKNSDL